MIASDLPNLLHNLTSEQPSLTLEEVVQRVREHGRPGRDSAVFKQCSLVRSFDRNVFDFLCGELKERPSFDALVAAHRKGELRSDGLGWWHVTDSTREHYLKQWQTTSPGEWKDWNRRLAEYFLAQPGPFAQVHALYHLAVANQGQAAELFPKWFAAADETFDLAQCNALLEVLRTQENWRGPKLSLAWQTHRQHYLARSLFLQDYYRTASYLERKNPLIAFRQVLNQEKPGRWIFHIHATGGIGKTMFLRWLISRDLIPNKIPCARVDFDDFKSVSEVVNAPLRLMVRIVEQIDQQLPQASLTSLLERLRREQEAPGWNPNIMAELRRQLKGAGIKTPVVIVLDTLEEPTLSHGQWLRESIDQLRTFRESIPKLCLILSGRYNVVSRIPGLDSGEYLHFELMAFARQEAKAYLTQRGVSDSAIREAMIRKIGGEPFAGANPFMLALLTELALNRKALSPQDIEKLPRVDFAYLIERIILRIESQPLRWVLRYGAIPRDLTREYIEQVLLAPLKAALSGAQAADQPNQTSHAGMEHYRDAWVPDPEALNKVTAAGLWQDLVKFARDRGWVSLVDNKGEIARFHPEVINPTRDLLRTQPVFEELQRRSILYFERLAAQAPTPQEWAAATCEAIFHHFHLEGPAAHAYWEAQGKHARTRGVDVCLRIVQEVLGRDYAEGETKPVAFGSPMRPIVSSETLARAHCTMAELLLEQAGVSYFPEAAAAKDFRRHIQLARAIGEPITGLKIPGFLLATAAAFQESTPAGILKKLQEQRANLLPDRQRFLLEVQLAEHYARLRQPQAVDHYLEAIQLWEGAKIRSIQPYHILLRLADWHQFAGDYAAMMDALRQARQTPGISQDDLAGILHREAASALLTNDLPRAEKTVEELWANSAPREGYNERVLLIEAQIALEKDDIIGAARRCEQMLPGSGERPADTALVYDILGRAANRQLEFEQALNYFERASRLYDDARIITGSARCAILQMRTLAMLQGNLREAESILHHAFQLPGAKDVDVYAELELLQSFIRWKNDPWKEAHPKLIELMKGKALSWPTRLRARLMVWSLAAGWHPPEPGFVDEVLWLLDSLQPVSARFLTLDILDYCDAPINLERRSIESFLNLLPSLSVNASSFIDTKTRRGQLLWLFGDQTAAEDELNAAAEGLTRIGPMEARFLKHWRINCARLQVGVDTYFGEMVDSYATGVLDTSPLIGAAKLRAGVEALEHGLIERAEQLLDWARNRLTSETLKSVWLPRLEEALSKLALAKSEFAGGKQHLEQAHQLYDELGDIPAAEKLQKFLVVRMSPPPMAAEPSPGTPAAEEASPSVYTPPAPDTGFLDAPAAGPSQPQRLNVLLADNRDDLAEWANAPRDAVLDRLLGNWWECAAALDKVLLNRCPDLSKAAEISLEITAGPLAGIPWEIAPSLANCEVLYRKPQYQGANVRMYQQVVGTEPFKSRIAPNDPEAIRLLLPHTGRDYREQNTTQAISGFDLRRTWFLADTRPAVSYAPAPEELAKDLASRPCAVIHIVAAVREFSGGIFLDFESTEGRIHEERGLGFSFLTSTFLDRILASLEQPPFVILDIARSDNDAETLRRLLLRNIYADQLHRLGNTCGVLATGLVDRFGQEGLIEPLVHQLAMGVSISMILRHLRANQQPTSPHQPLVSELPSLGAALFADDPHISPFAPRRPSA